MILPDKTDTSSRLTGPQAGFRFASRLHDCELFIPLRMKAVRALNTRLIYTCLESHVKRDINHDLIDFSLSATYNELKSDILYLVMGGMDHR